MTATALIVRLGTQDNAPPAGVDDYTNVDLQLVTGNQRLGSGLGNAIESLTDLGAYPSEIGIDLLLLAAAIHAADTRVSRDRTSQDSWTRELAILVPVSDPDRWNTTRHLLRTTLNFLTGDRWSVSFRARPHGFERMAPTRPLTGENPSPPFSTVSLFSGGLDSFVGAIDLLETGQVPLLVSHAGEGPTSTAQRACLQALEAAYERDLAHHRVWMNFPKHLVPGSMPEDTTRGRSFLFFSLAACAATAFPNPVTIHVPENGLISLNVPLDTLRLGSLSTRTTHPFYMARWNELLQALGLQVSLHNPYRYQTKGEMCRQCRNVECLRENLHLTLSCSAPAKGRFQHQASGHCGHCVPCVIRRASIMAAFGADPTLYTLANLRQHALNTKGAEGQQVRSFQIAASRVVRSPGLANLLIHKPGPLRDDMHNIVRLAQVYLRGMTEVHELLDGVVTRPSR